MQNANKLFPPLRCKKAAGRKVLLRNQQDCGQKNTRGLFAHSENADTAAAQLHQRRQQAQQAGCKDPYRAGALF